ncbi:MAG TPA: hypothetical protein VNN76_10935 [Bacteroidota bacterium]|nr:hypothetical protein [Bacteroidota bacterium]
MRRISLSLLLTGGYIADEALDERRELTNKGIKILNGYVNSLQKAKQQPVSKTNKPLKNNYFPS